MSIEQAQRDLNARFVYKPEAANKWRILKDLGQVWGDCEDYALTLIWLAEGKSMLRFWLALLTFKYCLWRCKSPNGVGHVVLWARGHGWTDNMLKIFVSGDEMETRGYTQFIPYPSPIVAAKFLLLPILNR